MSTSSFSVRTRDLSAVRGHVRRLREQEEEEAAVATLQAHGWTVTPGTREGVLVAERGARRLFGPDARALAALIPKEEANRWTK